MLLANRALGVTLAESSRDSKPPWQEKSLIVGLLLVGVLLPLAVAALAGSLEIPRNDDWSYRHIALDLARTGRFALDGISETMIIGQIVFVQPFLWVSGEQPWAFTAAGGVFAVGATLGAFALARQVLHSRDATMAALSLTIFPGYLAYATSFMSDVPAIAAEFICLTLGLLALRERPVRMGWLLLSAASGIVAFSVREFAVAAPASVLAATICVDPRRAKVWALATGVALCCVGIHLWRTSLPGQLGPIGSGLGSPDRAGQALTTVALVVAPLALVGAIRWRAYLRRSDIALGLAIGGAFAAERLGRWFHEGTMPRIINENLMSQYGAPGGYLEGNRPQLFDDTAWALMNVVALASLVIVLGVGTGIALAHFRRNPSNLGVQIRRIGSPAGALVLFCLAVSGGLLLFSLSRPVFDRYFWPMVPPLGILFLYLPRDLAQLTRPARRSNLVLAACFAAITTVLVMTSLSYLLNSYAFGAARWTAGEQLSRLGVPLDAIDAGYEWVGFHATTQGDPTHSTNSVTFYRSWWPSLKICGLVTSDAQRLGDTSLVGSVEYRLNLVAGPIETLYLYRKPSVDCR